MRTATYLVLTTMLLSLTALAVSADDVTAAASAEGLIEQSTCPVMKGNPINTDLHVDYKGKRVYFCCNTCVGLFQKDPEKYLEGLPQFKTPSAPDVTGDDEVTHSGFGPRTLIEPLGIATFAFLAFSVLSGLFRRRLTNKFMRVHKVLTFTTFSLAALHGLMIFLAG